MTSKEIGNLAENLATKILINKNFQIMKRNFRSKSLSMYKNNFIYAPKEQITRKKQFKIKSTANYFLTKNNLHNLYYKFDLIEIKFWGNKKYSYNYIENIF